MLDRLALLFTAFALIAAVPAHADVSDQDLKDCISGSSENGLLIKACTKALTLQGLSAEQRGIYLNSRGMAHHRAGEYDLAIADFSEALIGFQHQVLYVNRGKAWESKGDYPRAISDYSEAISRQPNWILPTTRRGILYVLTRNFDAALTDFNNVIKFRPNSADAYFNRGMANLLVRNIPLARADFDRALEIDPKNLDGLIQRAGIALMERDGATYMSLLNRAIEVAPDRADLYAKRCSAWRTQNEKQKARDDCALAIKLDPSMSEQLSEKYRGQVRIGGPLILKYVD